MASFAGEAAAAEAAAPAPAAAAAAEDAGVADATKKMAAANLSGCAARFQEMMPKGADTEALKKGFHGKNVLFYIERTNNSNCVIYDAQLVKGADGKMALKADEAAKDRQIKEERAKLEAEGEQLMARAKAMEAETKELSLHHDRFVESALGEARGLRERHLAEKGRLQNARPPPLSLLLGAPQLAVGLGLLLLLLFLLLFFLLLPGRRRRGCRCHPHSRRCGHGAARKRVATRRRRDREPGRGRASFRRRGRRRCRRWRLVPGAPGLRPRRPPGGAAAVRPVLPHAQRRHAGLSGRQAPQGSGRRARPRVRVLGPGRGRPAPAGCRWAGGGGRRARRRSGPRGLGAGRRHHATTTAGWGGGGSLAARAA